MNYRSRVQVGQAPGDSILPRFCRAGSEAGAVVASMRKPQLTGWEGTVPDWLGSSERPTKGGRLPLTRFYHDPIGQIAVWIAFNTFRFQE